MECEEMNEKQTEYLNEWINDFELVNDSERSCTFALIILNLVLKAIHSQNTFTDVLIDDIVLECEEIMLSLYGELWY